MSVIGIPTLLRSSAVLLKLYYCNLVRSKQEHESLARQTFFQRLVLESFGFSL